MIGYSYVFATLLTICTAVKFGKIDPVNPNPLGKHGKSTSLNGYCNSGILADCFGHGDEESYKKKCGIVRPLTLSEMLNPRTENSAKDHDCEDEIELVDSLGDPNTPREKLEEQLEKTCAHLSVTMDCLRPHMERCRVMYQELGVLTFLEQMDFSCDVAKRKRMIDYARCIIPTETEKHCVQFAERMGMDMADYKNISLSKEMDPLSCNQLKAAIGCKSVIFWSGCTHDAAQFITDIYSLHSRSIDSDCVIEMDMDIHIQSYRSYVFPTRPPTTAPPPIIRDEDYYDNQKSSSRPVWTRVEYDDSASAIIFVSWWINYLPTTLLLIFRWLH